MKNQTKLMLLVLVSSSMLLSSCKKCKECYHIEEDNGNKAETYIGKFCGDEVADQEGKEFIAVSGKAYNVCR